MKSYITLLSFCIFFPIILFSQSNQAQIDDYIIRIEQEKADTERVELMGALASSYRFIDLEAAKSTIEEALELTQQINYIPGEIKCLYMSGVIYRMEGDMDKALQFGKASLELATQEEDWFWAGANGNSLGNTYSTRGVYDTATIYFIKAIDAYEKGNFPNRKAMIYNNLGDNFFDQKDYQLAEEYFGKALKIYRDSNNMKEAAMALMNMGRTQQNDSIARVYFDEALLIHTQNNDLQGIASVKMNIGNDFIDSKNYEAAIPYYSEALDLIIQVGHKRKTAIAHNALGNIYLNLNESNKAIPHFERALELTEITKAPKEARNINRNLAELYESQQDYEKALFYSNTARTLNDSIMNQQRLALGAELEAKYDAKQKEATLASQQLVIEKQKNDRNRLMVIGSLLLLGIIVIFQRYYYHQKRKKQEALLALEIQKTEAEALRNLDQLKTKFFSNISHELRTPLTLVIGPLEESLRNKKNSKKDGNLELAYSNSKKLLTLVNEILDLSKIEAGKLELNEKPVRLSPLIKRIFYSFQSLAQIRNQQLEFQSDLPQDLSIQLDVEKFEKIINNLLSNALKFSKQGGVITLVASQNNQDQSLLFKIKDSGAGIPSEDLDKIFDRFYQSQSGKTAGGTGIGLALAKELAQLFGGDLKASSIVDKGSTFSLHIPLKKAAASFAPPKNSESIDATPLILPENDIKETTYQPILLGEKKPRILIVEDNLEMSDFLVKTLESFYDCKQVYNGREALQLLALENFDLVTSDVMMPEMDGFEFRKTMNENKSWRGLSFIMLTARTLEEDKLKGFNLGVDDYITKPFSSPELLARIDNLLRNKQARAEFQEENGNEEVIESADQQLLKQAEQIVLDHIDDSEFKVTDLAKEIGYSPRQLGRVIKRLSGLSPVNFILEIRLQKAFQLFQNRQFATVSEVRYEIGIESAAYFTTKFKERFGKSPKEFLIQ